MTHTLLHKNLPVAELDFDAATNSIGKITALYHGDHLPVGVGIRKGAVDRAALNQWWADRSIPSTRDGLIPALLSLGLPDPARLLDAHLGLSLTDHYWLKPQGSSLAWEDVNFFSAPRTGPVTATFANGGPSWTANAASSRRAARPSSSSPSGR